MKITFWSKLKCYFIGHKWINAGVFVNMNGDAVKKQICKNCPKTTMKNLNK